MNCEENIMANNNEKNHITNFVQKKMKKMKTFGAQIIGFGMMI